MRLAIALLLLCAGFFHPVAHFADEATTACPCVHAATIDLARPATAGLTLTTSIRAAAPALFVPAAVVSEVPARAPPSA